MNTPSSIRCCVRTTENICTLPPIAVQDWTRRCATALSELAPDTSVLCLAARIDPSTARLDVFSAGVAQHHDDANPAQTNTHDHRLIALQDQAERLTTLGLTLPQHALTQGLIAPLDALDSRWRDSPFGRALNAGQSRDHPILMVVPIHADLPGICLILCIAGSDEHHQSHEHDEYRLTATLSALFPLLSERASLALSRVSNPRAWLTERERAILDLLIEGHSVRVIAEQLGRSSHTVHDHVKNLHKKIHASSRGELIAKALGHHDDQITGQSQAPIVLGEHRDRIMELKPEPIRAQIPRQ